MVVASDSGCVCVVVKEKKVFMCVVSCEMSVICIFCYESVFLYVCVFLK